jgi:hypothetical protein
MTHMRIQGRLLIALLAALTFTALVVPALAIADPGDSPDAPINYGVPFSTSTTLTPVHLWTWYSVTMAAGQTVQISAITPGADVGLLMGTYDDPYHLQGSYVPGSAQLTLSFLAPRSQAYLLAVSSSESTGQCPVTAVLTPAQPFTLASMTAPRSVRHSRSFTVTAKTFPAYNSLRSPIKFVVERKSGKRWKSYSSAWGRFMSEVLGGASSKSTTNLKLTKRGTYRVRARFSDSAHPAAKCSTWKTVKIN